MFIEWHSFVGGVGSIWSCSRWSPFPLQDPFPIAKPRSRLCQQHPGASVFDQYFLISSWLIPFSIWMPLKNASSYFSMHRNPSMLSGLFCYGQASTRRRTFLYTHMHTRHWRVSINITLVEFACIASGCKSRSRHRQAAMWLLTFVLFRVFVQVFESQIPSRLYSVSLNKQLFNQKKGPVCRLRLIERPCAV